MVRILLQSAITIATACLACSSSARRAGEREIAFVLIGTSCQHDPAETERWWYCAAANPFTGAQLQAATSFTVCFRTRAKCVDAAKETGFNCTLAAQAWCPQGREGHDDYLCYFDRRICEAADSRQPCIQILP